MQGNSRQAWGLALIIFSTALAGSLALVLVPLVFSHPPELILVLLLFIPIMLQGIGVKAIRDARG